MGCHQWQGYGRKSAMVKGSGMDEREVLIEVRRVGNAVKATALDPVTLKEVTIVGSPRDGEELLKRAVIAKLRYVLNKSAGQAE